MVTYDPAVISKYASALYKKADAIMMNWALGMMLVLAGVGEGAWLAFGTHATNPQGQWFLIGIGAVLGFLFGLSVGRSRAFVLKLQAQQALCQAQIEQNTRATSAR